MENYKYLRHAVKIVKKLIENEEFVNDNIINFLLDTDKNKFYTPEFMAYFCGSKISANILSGLLCFINVLY